MCNSSTKTSFFTCDFWGISWNFVIPFSFVIYQPFAKKVGEESVCDFVVERKKKAAERGNRDGAGKQDDVKDRAFDFKKQTN